jgi:hypothetical protein
MLNFMAGPLTLEAVVRATNSQQYRREGPHEQAAWRDEIELTREPPVVSRRPFRG